jgi:2-keto-4-pentenoate hydratase/2-oxohepta-3-ene-1,7-dioic acid hydratase in catechol pathway
MKLISFQHGSTASYGVVSDGGIIDVGHRLDHPYLTLRAVLEANALAEVARYIEGRSPDVRFDEITFLPVIPNPNKILCVGINYEAHRLETGRDKTEHPVIFTRFANSQVGHDQPIIRPNVSDKLDYEGELAVIIGKSGRHISRAAALSHVAGYACYNDGSVRDWQRHTSQFTPGKNFYATGGFGPWMVTSDEIPDPTKLTLVTRLNGAEMQRTSTDDLIFTIPDLIAYISTFTQLAPGDVISTGTPGGVGFKRNPPVFMKPGDVVEVEISGIGVLRNPIIKET